MLHGVIFDFNGTLFFDSIYHLQVFNELHLQITGKPLTMQEMESTYAGKPNIEIFKMMSNNTYSNETCEQLSKQKEAMYRTLVKESKDAKLCRGSETVFDLLKEKNIPFTIASASIKENIDFFIETFHLDKWINPSTIVYDDGTYVNKVKMFEKAKENLGIKDHVVICEDSLSGIQCADEVGASIIAIYRDTLKQYYKNYPSIIQTVQDLQEAIPTISSLINS